MIPKIIHTSWEGAPPSLVRWCLKLMRAKNPDWHLKFHDITSLKEQLPSAKIVQHRSDWQRVTCVEEEGGVWLDASCLCLQPIESWVDMSSASLQGFTYPGNEDIQENWAFAAPPRHPLMILWKNELEKAHDLGFDTYCEQLPMHIKESLSLPYLTSHAALAVARQRAPQEKVSLKSSIAEGSPYRYMQDANWKVEIAMLKLWMQYPQLPRCKLTNSVPEFINGVAFYKLRGSERQCWWIYEIVLIVLLLISLVVVALTALSLRRRKFA